MAILPIILFFAILAVDQITKIIVAAADVQFVIIDGLLSFEYTQNSGAAFGLFGSQSWGIALFSLISIAAIVVCFVALTKTNSKLLSSGLMVLAGGTAGNLIDRLCTLMYQMFGDKFYGLDGFAGGVRDFLNIQFFANINIADIAITAGVIIICLYLLFLGKDPVFNFKKKKAEEPAVEAPVEASANDKASEQ
ncbi:MAG: signal peptidase II [Clostridia bacterium]|nr:signal peptidase II [Clostridia bacterium]